MKNLLFIIFNICFINTIALAIDIPSKDNLTSDSEVSEFRRQERLLKKIGYRIGNSQRNETIRKKIETHEVCENAEFKTGLLKNNTKSVYEYDFIIAKNIDAVKSLPPKCRKNFLLQYLAFKGSKDKPSESCENGPCDLYDKAKEQYLANLDDLGFDQLQVFNIEIFDPNKSSCNSPSIIPDIIEEIAETAEVIEQTKECTPLKLGETRKTRSDDYLDGVEQKYTVTNIGNNTHRIDLNIDFQADNSGFANKSQAERKALERMKKCMLEVNKVAKDSKGRKFEFNILSPEEVRSNLPRSKRPPKVAIKLTKNEINRQSSRLYKDDIDCPTMTHEMLHLLGLHDEYSETQIGHLVHKVTGKRVKYYNRDNSHNAEFARIQADPELRRNYDLQLAYQCRSLSKKKTIMSDVRLLNDIMPSQTLCECSSENSARSVSRCSSALSLTNPAIRKKYLNLQYTATGKIPNFSEFCKRRVGSYSSRPMINLSNLTSYKPVSNVLSSSGGISFTNRYLNWRADGTRILVRESIDCSCSPLDFRCQETINSINEYSWNEEKNLQYACPTGTTIKKSSLANFESVGLSDPSKQVIVSRKPVSVGLPLLEDAYAEKILYPKCGSRAKKYLKCIESTYSPVGDSCNEKPDYCSDDSFLSEI